MSEETQPTTETPAVKQITTIPYTMEVPKEGMEVVNAIALLVNHFANGGTVVGVTQHLDDLKDAVVGAKDVLDEMKSSYKDELAGYTVHKLWGAFDK